ncbi:tetratricopeptide repeat protein [Flavobacterium sp. ST-87]|uniref:Tetratricopeptide repeat protein n=1 Tax=Flavobacterium plantiphilum TaxID=3163297 RepID=A0ABW8XVE5_9FLAO
MKQLLIVFLFLPLLVFSQSDFEKAQQFFQAGKWKESQEIFEKIVKTEPSNINVLEKLGDIAGHLKNWDAALMYYGKLKKIKPSEADFYFKYGGVLGMKALEVNKFRAFGMIDEIKSSFEKAIQLDPKHIEARWALIELYLKLPGIAGGSESKALKYSNELMQLSPVDGYLSRGHIEEYFNRYKNAEQQYKKAINVGNSKKAYLKLANLYKNKMNQQEKASAILETLKNSNSIPKKNI